MKYARVNAKGRQSWGVVRDGDIHLVDTTPYEANRETGEVISFADVALLAPVTPSKIICVGKNYADHRVEMGFAAEQEPSIFMKPPTTIIGPGRDIILPPVSISNQVEHEAELAVVIGKMTRFVSEDAALDHVLGYTCADDVSARDLQRSDPYPTRGKGFDTFCPIGPWIETDLDIDAGVAIRGSVNGQLRHSGSTNKMTYTVRYLISYISQFTTLIPGDVILTGSPGGTGPLRPGDKVEVDVEGIGVLQHGVLSSSNS